jgi:ectoine hydroxylase-related dioxygenase (phytanoyl-CoA dioxygenase family)
MGKVLSDFPQKNYFWGTRPFFYTTKHASMRRVLQDETLQNSFEEKGYTVLPGFLSAEEVKHYYDHYLARLDKGETHKADRYEERYAEFTVIYADETFRRSVYAKLTGELVPRCNEFLADYKPIIANYIMKLPGGKGHVPLHQNWSLVNEEEFTSVSVWIALVDMGPENGMLSFVDGSHRQFRFPRGYWNGQRLDNIEPFVLENDLLTGMPVKAGDAIVLDDSILHHSALNRSSDIRLSMQIIMIPRESQGIYFHREHPGNAEYDGDVEVFAVDEEFFFRFEHGRFDPEKRTVIGTVPLKVPTYTEQTFTEALGRAPKQVRPWWSLGWLFGKNA